MPAETVRQIGRDVELAAADMDLAGTRLAEGNDAGVQTMHERAEGHQVERALGKNVEPAFHDAGILRQLVVAGQNSFRSDSSAKSPPVSRVRQRLPSDATGFDMPAPPCPPGSTRRRGYRRRGRTGYSRMTGWASCRNSEIHSPASCRSSVVPPRNS